MLPLVGAFRRTRLRATVDLPQPDSPTSPSVSPASTANDTPSTARTTGGLPSRSERTHASRPRSGNCTRRSWTSQSGGTAILDGEAGDPVVRRDLLHRRLVAPAAILDPRAAAGIAAAGRRVEQRRHRTRDRLHANRAVDSRDRAHQ